MINRENGRKFKMEFTIIGAGRTGRGFIAPLLSDFGHITFIDRDTGLVNELREKGSYAVGSFSSSKRIEIRDFEAYTNDDAEVPGILALSDAVFISVRGENYPSLIPFLEKHLPYSPVPFIICENAVLPSALLGPLEDSGCSAAVFATSMIGEGLDIVSENYPYLHTDGRNMPEILEGIPGIRPEPDFPLLMKRKIFTYNSASALISYLGRKKGYTVYSDAANDPEISEKTDMLLKRVDHAFHVLYGVDEEDQERFSGHAKLKFRNEAIRDTIERNAASPLRKLGTDERIIGPMKLIRDAAVIEGKDPREVLISSFLPETARAALQMAMEKDPSSTYASILAKTSRLSPNDVITRCIIDA